MLNANAFFSGTATTPWQHKRRLQMTEAIFNDARDSQRQSVVWLFTCFAQIFLFVAINAAYPHLMDNLLRQSPYSIIPLGAVLLADMTYIACFNHLYTSYQHTMDKALGIEP